MLSKERYVLMNNNPPKDFRHVSFQLLKREINDKTNAR